MIMIMHYDNKTKVLIIYFNKMLNIKLQYIMYARERGKSYVMTLIILARYSPSVNGIQMTCKNTTSIFSKLMKSWYERLLVWYKHYVMLFMLHVRRLVLNHCYIHTNMCAVDIHRWNYNVTLLVIIILLIIIISWHPPPPHLLPYSVHLLLWYQLNKSLEL